MRYSSGMLSQWWCTPGRETDYQYMVVGNNFDTVEGLHAEQAVYIRADHFVADFEY